MLIPFIGSNGFADLSSSAVEIVPLILITAGSYNDNRLGWIH